MIMNTPSYLFNKIKYKSFMILILLLILIHFQLISLKTSYNINKVLLIGDFGNEVNFSMQVKESISDYLLNKDDFNIIDFDTSKYTDKNKNTVNLDILKYDLFKKVSEYNLLAVIDSSTTDLSLHTSKLCSILGLPVFITVSTNDEILNYNNSNVVRIIANDSKQIKAIQDWINKENNEYIIILYENSVYASFIFKNLNIDNKSKLIVFPFDNNTSISNIIMNLKLNLDNISSNNISMVYIGYNIRVRELMDSLNIFFPEISILLTDGSYCDYLLKLNRVNTYLSFPLNIDGGKNNGFGIFGEKSIELIILGEDNRRKRRVNLSLIESIKDVIDKLSDEEINKLGVLFDNNGENIKSHFTILDWNDFNRLKYN